MKKNIVAFLLGVFLLSQAWGMGEFVVRDIRIEGLQRISAGTVFNYLPLKVGDTIDSGRSSEVIRSLYRTGFFKDVRLEREGDVLVVSVHERPAISEINFSGNKDIDDEDLTEALKGLGLAEGRVYDKSKLDKVEQELQRLYFSQGKYGAKVVSTVTPLERNRVAVSIEISEGLVAKIYKINIVGNKVFSDKDLLDEFELTTPGMLSFVTKSDQYSKQQLAADLETLRSFYLDRGYINFNIESTQVAITSDKKDIYITINIAEGEQFSIGDIKLAGNLVVKPEELSKLIESKKGEVFSRIKITDSSNKISERLGGEGYAFANVNAVPDIDDENKTVAITFFVDPGKRVYVRRINMSGNTKTADAVMRREVRQMEGAWISTDKVKRSRERIDKTGYFDEVNVETPAVPGSSDQVDVNFSVKEKASGSLALGLGYSQSSGILFNTNVSQNNFLGTGKRITFVFNNSDVNTNYSFGFLDPYYTLDGVSRGFNVFLRETDAGEANVGNFVEDAVGGSVTFGLPINEYDTVRFSLGVEDTEIKTTATTPTEYQNFITANGAQFATLKLNGSWSHDTRNRNIFPDRGAMQRASIELVGGDLQYYKMDYRQLRFFPLTKSLTLSLNGEIAYGDTVGEAAFPFFENYYGGGPGSVRGFEANSLGPKSASNESLGGNLKVIGSVELIFPPPFIKKGSKSLRMSGFFDVGNVFGFNEDFDVGELRYSAGVSATWLSPFGAFTFSFAQPLNDDSSDEVQAFQFTLGNNF